jgi:uncharacterized membrane protein
MTGEEMRAPGSTEFIVRPNRSLSVAGIIWLFITLSTMALTVGIGLTLAGAWLVLPFAGIEVLAVGALCGWLYRHRDDCELIVIEPEHVRIIQRSGCNAASYEFQRYWVRVILDRRDGQRPSRLQIGSHGKYVRLAAQVTEGDRLALAGELRNALRH